jgi:hypothetical protein
MLATAVLLLALPAPGGDEPRRPGQAQAQQGGVTLQISMATVSAPGESAQICVSLNSGGAEVAGTQNDLVWDGGCATLASTGSCQAAGGHGKQLQGGFPPQFDFTYRALILSLADVDPIPDGLLYCCNFQSEAAPGQCCNIGMTRVGASDPRGSALPTTAVGQGQICTARGSGLGSGGGGGPMGGASQPAGNVGGPPLDAGAPPPAAPPAGGGTGAGAPPPAAVLPGGGGRVADVPAQVPAEVVAEPTLAPTPAAAAPGVAAAPGGALQRPIAPPLGTPSAAAAMPATAAPTTAPTSPAAADTATAAPATVPPTAAKKATLAAVKSEPQAAPAERGWFGCRLGGSSGAPVATLGAMAAIAVAARRWRRKSSRWRQRNH